MNTAMERLRANGYTSWPSLLAWFSLLLVIFQVAVLPSAYGRSNAETFVRFVYAVASMTSAVLIIVTVTKLQGRRRISAILAAFGFSGGAIAYLYQFAAYLANLPALNWITESLYTMLYICSIFAIAVYFRWDLLWLGNILRVLLDSVVVGYSLYVILYDVLPRTHLAWAIHLNGYITFDIAIVFALCVVVIRYGKSGGPIIVFVVMAIICLLIGDLVYTYFNFISNFKSSVPSMPLYAIDGILVGLAHYRSLSHPPREGGGLTHIRSTSEWLIWYFMPLQLLLLAFVKVSFFGHADAPSSILILFALGFVHELVAIMDYRRVLENLRAAQLALAAANEQNVRLLEQRQIAAAEVAHDMGNALQNIWLTITKLKQVIPADVARAQGLDAAEAAMAFCEDLLTALVAAAQLDAGALQLSLKPTDLKALVSRILRQLTPHAFLGGVQIQFHPAPILPLSYCDAHLVARALANIINNAIKYTAAARPGSGQVIIQITPVGGQLQITVLDNGPGMTSADQARIGQRFIRGATAIGAPAGFGLGLTFARGVIEQHPQGEFAIKAQIGGGTCVTMMLAMAEALEE